MKIKHVFSLFVLLFLSAAGHAQEAHSASPKEKDRPVKILHRPLVPFPHTCKESAGLARLKVTLEATGKVTSAILALSSGCRDFDDEAALAASHIKFKPAIKDGEPVTRVLTFEYTFNSY